jgi:hypothetical protein
MTTMVAAIKRRDAVDGCGCIRCRDIDPALARRSTVGDIRWTLRMFCRRPWLLVLVAGLAFLYLGLKLVIYMTTTPTGLAPRIIHHMQYLLLLAIFLRGFFGTIVAVEVTNRKIDAWRLVAYTTQRLVPLALTIGGILLILGVTLGVSIVFVSILVFDLGLLNPTIFHGITPTLLFGSVLAPVFYKFWIAPDVCVVGEEGPLTALRSSWRITTTHWRRVCLLIASFTVTIMAPYVVAEVLSLITESKVSSIPAFTVLATQFQWLTAVVWYCVGAQIYIRSALI